MESRPGGTNILDPSVQTAIPATISAQPWWCGPVFAAVNTSKSPVVGTEAGQLRLSHGLDDTGDVNKEADSMGTKPGSLIYLFIYIHFIFVLLLYVNSMYALLIPF